MRSVTYKALALLLCLALCMYMVPTAFAADSEAPASITIPQSATVIEAEAFMNCGSIARVTIPAGVSRIGQKAFYGCTGLTDVYYGGTEAQWDEIAIENGNGPLTRAAIHCDSAYSYYIDLTYSNVFIPNEWNYKAAEKFAQMVTERTDGHVKIDFHGFNELDCFRDSVVHAVNGENWIGLEDPSCFADWVGDCAVLVGPMLYNSNEEYNYVMDSDLVAGIKDALADENIHILDTHYSFGFRSINTNKYIYTPADLAGVKLRSTTSPLFLKTIEAMGATPVPMSFTECLSAIPSGLVDGFESSTSTLAGAGAPYELVKKVALTNHFIATRWLFMAENVYQEMPLKWRSILDQCALECGVWEQASVAEDEAVQIQRLRQDAGVVYNAVDVDAFTSACAPVFDWIADSYHADPGLFSKIVSLVKEFRGETANSAVRLLNGNIQIDTPLKHAARAYEEATGKHVEIESLGGGVDQQAALKQYYQAGSMPDIFVFEGASDLANWTGMVVDMSDQPWAADTDVGFVDESGALVGFPYTIEAIGLACNKSILQRAGVDPASITGPASMKAAFETIDAKKDELGITAVIGYSANASQLYWSTGQHLFGQYLDAGLDRDDTTYFDMLMEGKLDTERFTAFAEMVDLFNKYSDPALLVSGNYDMQVSGFAAGKYAFVTQGSWIGSSMTNNYPAQYESAGNFECGYVPYAFIEGIDTILADPISHWAVYKGGNVAKAEEFLNWLAGPDGQRIMVQEAGCVSPFKSCTVTANDPFAAPISGFVAAGKTSAWHWMGQPSNLAQDYTGIIFQNFASGVINTEQFVQNMKNAVSAGIASWQA